MKFQKQTKFYTDKIFISVMVCVILCYIIYLHIKPICDFKAFVSPEKLELTLVINLLLL